ncbi:hypothetical protein SLA_3446 [Streptomyces laurentii]|uniref:DNA primase/polymerase bifunctional N-terminal domain-containing protein n=1 Tax=Streptomyces laurentii TaxID=39478 RepID=A0A160P161_STRLU|nr:hypothetical protein SLA_3446 [Streptomyces laurentii]
MQFDAIRVDGDDGRRLTDWMATLTGGDPGPVVIEENGRRGVYFLVAPGSTANRSWPPGVTRFNQTPGNISYIPVPALTGNTWPLAWCFPPTVPGRFVHTLLLRCAVTEMLS